MEIRLKSVEKSFNRKKVIQSTILSMVSGGLSTLLGLYGCGKTILLQPDVNVL